MMYVLANIDKAKAHQFNPRTHGMAKQQMILNEKEVMNSRFLSGTLEERALALGGTVHNHTEMELIISKG